MKQFVLTGRSKPLGLLLAALLLLTTILTASLAPYLAGAASDASGVMVDSHINSSTSTAIVYAIDIENNQSPYLALSSSSPLYIRPIAGNPKFKLSYNNQYHFTVAVSNINSITPHYSVNWFYGSDAYGEYIAVYTSGGYMYDFDSFLVTVTFDMTSSSYGAGTYTFAAGVNSKDTSGYNHYVVDYKSVNR